MMEETSDRKDKFTWKNISPGIFTGNLKNAQSKGIYLKRIFIGSNKPEKITKRIVFLHDLLEHHGRYEECILANKQLWNSSVEIIFLDFAGHGLSSGSRGHIESLDYLVDDLILVLQNLDPIKELYFFGHGIGALVFLRFLLFKKAIEHSSLLNGFSGLIASNFYFDLSKRINPMTKILDLIEKRSVATSQIQLEHIKLNRLIHGVDQSFQKEVQEKYEADPLVVHRLTYRGYRAIEEGILEISRKAYFIDFPFLCLIGKNDPIINAEKMQLFMKSIEKKHYRVIELPDSKHDLYNDTDSSFVFKEIINWVENE